jgi:hypothetical protein
MGFLCGRNLVQRTTGKSTVEGTIDRRNAERHGWTALTGEGVYCLPAA